MTSVLASLSAFGDYQYIVSQPERVVRRGVACSAPAPLNAAGHVSVRAAAAPLSAKTRTAQASAGADLLSTPYTGAVLLIR